MRRPIIAILTAVAVVLVACQGATTTAGAATGATKVTATLSDKDITLSAASVPAGKVTFALVNSGTVMHTFVVLRTDTPQDKIPADPKDASKVVETGSVGKSGEIQPGQTRELTVDLASGKYVLVCNEPAHYILGMHTAFTVK